MGSMTIGIDCIALARNEVLAVHDAAACARCILPVGLGASQRCGLTCRKLVAWRCVQVRYGLDSAVDDGYSNICTEIAVSPHCRRVDGLRGVFGGRNCDGLPSGNRVID